MAQTSLIAFAAAMAPKSYGSSTTGVKKSVVTISARPPPRSRTAASSGSARPTRTFG
jgi:hypothetical protein